MRCSWWINVQARNLFSTTAATPIPISSPIQQWNPRRTVNIRCTRAINGWQIFSNWRHARMWSAKFPALSPRPDRDGRRQHWHQPSTIVSTRLVPTVWSLAATGPSAPSVRPMPIGRPPCARSLPAEVKKSRRSCCRRTPSGFIDWRLNSETSIYEQMDAAKRGIGDDLSSPMPVFLS